MKYMHFGLWTKLQCWNSSIAYIHHKSLYLPAAFLTIKWRILSGKQNFWNDCSNCSSFKTLKSLITVTASWWWLYGLCYCVASCIQSYMVLQCRGLQAHFCDGNFVSHFIILLPSNQKIPFHFIKDFKNLMYDARTLLQPNLQPTANQGMYNLRFTLLINTNNTSNYQSTNETHYTQENTTITTHKGSQLLILIFTIKRQRTSHRTYTNKNHNFTLMLPPPSLQNETTNVVINIIVVSSWWWA